MSRALLLALIALVASPSTCGAATDGPRGAIVVFGGFGYVDDIQNRRLIELIRRGAETAPVSPEPGLEQQLRADAGLLVGGRFGKWTSYGMVFDGLDLARAYGLKTGKRTRVDTVDMLKAFGRTYLLVLSSGLEHQTVLRTAYDAGVTYHAYAEVGVSASLIDVRGSGDIVLSATAIGISRDEALPVRDGPDDPVWSERYRAAYLVAAKRALSLLADLADKSDPRKPEKSLETYMVTGALVRTSPSDEGQLAGTLFAWQRRDAPVNFCAPVSGCEKSSNACEVLTGYLVTATSQALSQRGFRVLPPLTWRTATRDQGTLTRYRLSLPASPLPELASSAELDFDPRRATYKTIATLDGLTHTTAIARGGIVGVDSYGAVVNAAVTRTDPDDCRSRPKEEHMLDAKGIYDAVEDRHPASEPPLDAHSQQLQYLRAINLAIAKLAASGGH